MASISVANTPYTASWPSQLDPSHRSELESLAIKVKNFIFYIPISLAAACFNPRKECIIDREESARVQTPDGVSLGIVIQRPLGGQANNHVIIMFNPLGTNCGRSLTPFDYTLQNQGFTIVKFNYRGLGTTWGLQDLVLDGESVYQYVTQEMEVPANNVHFYGQSLGGAVAAQVKALHPECQGKYIGDRTFRSLFHVVADFLTISRLGSIIQTISSVFARSVAHALSWLGFDLNTEMALRDMNGEKKIFYLQNDSLISDAASARHACKEEEATLVEGESHFEPIYRFRTAESRKWADQAVTDFLLSSH